MGFQIRATAQFTPRNDIGRFIAERITPAVRQATLDAGQIVLSEAQDVVPVDTGALRNSGQVTVRETDTSIIADVAFTEPYAAYVEFGTGIRGSQSPGAGPYPYNPAWPGMAAQPYLRPALDTARPEMLGEFALRLRT